jgi:hypothetical protein
VPGRTKSRFPSKRPAGATRLCPSPCHALSICPRHNRYLIGGHEFIAHCVATRADTEFFQTYGEFVNVTSAAERQLVPISRHSAYSNEVLVRQGPAGKLRAPAADLERSKINASEAKPFDERRYLPFAAVSSPE